MCMVGHHISAPFSPCKTETLRPLNSSESPLCFPVPKCNHPCFSKSLAVLDVDSCGTCASGTGLFPLSIASRFTQAAPRDGMPFLCKAG